MLYGGVQSLQDSVAKAVATLRAVPPVVASSSTTTTTTTAAVTREGEGMQQWQETGGLSLTSSKQQLRESGGGSGTGTAGGSRLNEREEFSFS